MKNTFQDKKQNIKIKNNMKNTFQGKKQNIKIKIYKRKSTKQFFFFVKKVKNIIVRSKC